MVYKLANTSDLETLSLDDTVTRDVLLEFTSVLTSEYGADRNVDTDDGGYVLYAAPGTTPEELKQWFDYSTHTIEYVNREFRASPPLCCAMFLLNNDFSVVIVMSIEDAPVEIVDNFEAGY